MIERLGRPSASPSMERTLVVSGVGSAPIARCHPDRPMYRVGLCRHCYAEAQRDRRRTKTDPDARIELGLVLSPRERQIAAFITDGATNLQIAYGLGISEQTVKNHVSVIFRKTGWSSRTQIAANGSRAGYGVDGFDLESGTVITPAQPHDVWATYFEAVEENIDRLRQDLNGILVKLREARRLVYEPPTRKVPRFTGNPNRIVPTLRGRSKMSACRKGHPFSEANTRLTSKGTRACRTCHAAYAREKYRTLRDAAGLTAIGGRADQP